ncbi:McrC family protein [Metabacillus indicus]|uniref:McrC family protein n=1 Tax=Metabacillus indicus TaxID=246786 RepID=UPI002492BE47|nr:hypothetical protein [Metabacillus indicus]
MESAFKVPIRNLFCMLSYMNDMPELAESLSDLDEDIITYDFIANQFLKEVDRINRRGMIKDYVVRGEETNRLGGRLLINESLPLIMAKKPAVVCEKDEYSPNVKLNQVMKSTLKSISMNRYVREETRRRSFMNLELLQEVETRDISKGFLSKIYFGRHTHYYKRMIHIAKLLHELTLLSHKHGNWSLYTAELDDKVMNQLFEKFLFHFYRIEQKEYRVYSERMQWKLEGNRALLPSMQTDISLLKRDCTEKIIIDAKFYKNVFQENYGKSSFQSHNLYQLFTYLMHQPKEMNVRGILIYPFNEVEVNESYRWSERVAMEVMTVDLGDSWKRIHLKLRSILSTS